MSPTTIDEYLATLDDEPRGFVVAVLDTVRAALPGAEERVRYGMPALLLDRRYAIHVAGWKKHIGLYPVSPLPPELEERIAPYRAAKDAENFKYAEPIPHDLIAQVAVQLQRQRAAEG